MWAHCGILNAQALARDLETQSLWFPAEGYSFAGELEGTMLEPMVRLQSTWAEWKALHPDTSVLDLPRDPNQRDPREGHGAEEYWARPAIDQIFITSLAIDLNRELPENEPILGLNGADALRAYPFYDLKREGGVLNDDLAGLPIVILTGPEPESIKAMVFERRVGDRTLDFEIRDGAFIDGDTESEWSIEGQAVSGPLAGEQLVPVHFFNTRWHSWCYTHPGGEIWRTDHKGAPNLDTGLFGDAIAAWKDAGYDVLVERALLNVERPLETTAGLLVRVNGDRLKLHIFDNTTAADDYTYFFRHSVRRGLLVVESVPDPEEIYTDIATQRVRRPDDVVAWSSLLDDATFLEPLDDSAPADAGFYPGLRAFFERLGDWDCFPGIAIPMNQDLPVFSPMLTPTGRFPGVDNGAYATIGSGDNFVMYRFTDSETAANYASDETLHAFAVDRYVFRSIPVDKFRYPRFGAVDRDPEKVAWSDLVEDEDFIADVRSIVEG